MEICENNKYELLPILLYEEYKKDWCEGHGYDFAEMETKSQDDKYCGECFACYAEFCDNELQDGEYGVYLMGRILKKAPKCEALNEAFGIDDDPWFFDDPWCLEGV